jgi:hypothetical protein
MEEMELDDFYDFSDLKPGMRVNIEGAYSPADGTIRAHQISIKDDSEDDEIEATIESVDAAAGTIRVLGLTVRVSADVDIKDVDKSPLSAGALASGMRIKTKGRLLADGSFAPLKIKLKMHTPDAMDEIEGTITEIDPLAYALRVMGFRVVGDADVEIEA